MGLVTDTIEGIENCTAFAEFVEPVRKNSHDISAWLGLVKRIEDYAVESSNLGCARTWYREGWDVYRKAAELNPDNELLKRRIVKYREFLDKLGLPI